MAPHLPFVFIDTNVWFSAFYGSQNAEKLLKAHIESKITAVISEKVLRELTNNVRSKIPEAYKPLEKFLKSAPPIILTDPDRISEAVKEFVDKKDQTIFQAAINANIPVFVTGNLKHFEAGKIERKFPIKIFSPVKAIKYLNL